MKLVKGFSMMCLIAIVMTAAWAQNGPQSNHQGRNGNANCPLSEAFSSAQPLSADEAAHLLYIREEEKLALDIYNSLYSKWGLRIFSNIAASEQRHFDAVGTLIDRYRLVDPAKPTPGDFTNPELLTLFNDLLYKGSLSVLDALQVGVAIEEKDIDDLKAALSVTDNRDVLTVYGNLLKGSLNHLSAFNSHLDTLNSN